MPHAERKRAPERHSAAFKSVPPSSGALCPPMAERASRPEGEAKSDWQPRSVPPSGRATAGTDASRAARAMLACAADRTRFRAAALAGRSFGRPPAPAPATPLRPAAVALAQSNAARAARMRRICPLLAGRVQPRGTSEQAQKTPRSSAIEPLTPNSTNVPTPARSWARPGRDNLGVDLHMHASLERSPKAMRPQLAHSFGTPWARGCRPQPGPGAVALPEGRSPRHVRRPRHQQVWRAQHQGCYAEPDPAPARHGLQRGLGLGPFLRLVAPCPGKLCRGDRLPGGW